MNIFLTGGTGAVGVHVVRNLVRHGHAVTATARSDQAAAAVAAAGARPARCDLFDERAVQQAVGGHEAVVHLATAIPTGAAAVLSRSWEMTARLRREASRNLVGAAIAGGASRYVQESLAFAYPDGDDRWLDETTPLDPYPMQEAICDAERQTERFSEDGGSGVVLRFGMFYGPGSAHTDQEIAAGRKGISVRPGRAEAYLAVVHLEDAAAAVQAALGVPAGVYNVVDDEPLTRRAHAAALAAALGVDKLRLLPEGVGHLGKMRALARSHRVSNAKLRATGWAPAYPSAREGWQQTIRELGVNA